MCINSPEKQAQLPSIPFSITFILHCK